MDKELGIDLLLTHLINNKDHMSKENLAQSIVVIYDYSMLEIDYDKANKLIIDLISY